MSNYTVITSDYLEHHGVKGMRWGVINEEEKKVGRRLAASIKRNSQHAGYYNPNVGSSSSRVTQGGDKTGSSTSSGNDRRVSSKVNKNLRNSSKGSVVFDAGVKEKQHENKFNWPGDTLVDSRVGVSYRLKEKGGKTYEIKFPYDEMKKYDSPEDARNAIPNIVYQYCKDNDLYLTEKMFKAIVYAMSNALTNTYDNFGNYQGVSGQSLGHSAIDIIDVSDTLQHAQHEGYYSPNNTSNKATPYIFEKLVKSSSGNQIGARFKGQGDRQWVEIFVPTVDFTPNMQNFIALFNAEKGNVKIREEEMRKAARLLTNFFNSPSLPGNEKMTTYVRKPKSLKHALFTEVYDMDDYLEHHGILGMKWGVRRYQNKDGSLTAEGRKHYNVKTINSTRMELAGAESDREKRTILTKATNKAMGDQVKGIVAGTGSMVAGSLAKQAVARAAAGTIVRDLVYNSLTGTSSLVTSVIPAAVPAWAAALTTPVGQIALAAVGTAGAAKAIYGAYKSLKLNELAAEFDVSTNVNRIVREQTSVNSAVERGMQEYYKKLDSEEMDKAAHKEASRYGLDQADNYKVFRDALIGDEEAQRIVDEWKRNR